jgi:glutamine cyclotransferase
MLQYSVRPSLVFFPAARFMTKRPSRTKSPEAIAPAATRQPGAVRRRRWALALAVLTCAGAGVVWAVARERASARVDVEVVQSYPHDTRAYTQGLVYDRGELYEGTGKYGESTLRRVELSTGRVLQSVELSRDVFGEGITVWGGEVIQLTWRNQFGIVYDKSTLEERRRFRYAGEGWGLTHDGIHLIMSDGSSTLRFLDPKTFRVVRQLLVRSGGRRVANLNELEYVQGEILANIWYKNYIARISPSSGEVLGWIDLQTLVPPRLDRDSVANGIAYDAENDRLFVTGKNWPHLFEIRLVPR